jgi:precorrin-6A/cobalt-precorrin-6A reductase
VRIKPVVKKCKILLLSGTGEAREIESILQEDQTLEVISSLSGATRMPRAYKGATRSGGFGGYEAQKRYMLAQGFDLVVDATHPFAAHISKRTCDICIYISVPYMNVLRPEWAAEPADQWLMIDDPSEAVQHIAPRSVVFLATGRNSLSGFSNLSEMTLICRQIDPPDGEFPFKNGRYLIGRPPFSVDDEEKLFRTLGVDYLVVKNAGGAASRTKLDAARRLGIPVVMLRRPPVLKAPQVASVEAAIAWVNKHKERLICD